MFRAFSAPSFFIGLMALSSVAFAGDPVETDAVVAPTNGAACQADLDTPLVCPPRWNLVSEDIEAFRQAQPELDWLIRNDVALAQLLEEDSAELFEFLGERMNHGFSRHRLQEQGEFSDLSVAQYNRLLLAFTSLDEAVKRGLLPTRLDTLRTAAIIASGLGELPVAEDVVISAELVANVVAVKNYKALGKTSQISLKDLSMHSSQAQEALLRLCPSAKFVDFKEGLAAFRQRLLHGEDSANPALRHLVREAEDVLRGDFSKLTELENLRRDNRGLRRQFQLSVEQMCVGWLIEAFLENAGKYLTALYLKPDSETPQDPYLLLRTFQQIVENDVFVDRKLRPYFLRLLSQRTLGVSPLRGDEVAAAVRAALKYEFSETRRLGASFRAKNSTVTFIPNLAEPTAEAPGATPPSTRTDRMQSYARLARRLEAKQVENSLGPFARSFGSETPELSPLDLETAFWEELLASERPLPFARRQLAEKLRPDLTYTLPILRGGFRYRVQLSQRLMNQLLNPEDGAPEDFREWLEALRLGAARSVGQRGWKKLKIPVDGRYDWEIKLLTSPYRILGFKTPDGIWRFDTIRLMH